MERHKFIVFLLKSCDIGFKEWNMYKYVCVCVSVLCNIIDTIHTALTEKKNCYLSG